MFYTLPDLVYMLLIYRVIQKDGVNFVRLYFLTDTWYMNDLRTIWKTSSYAFKYHRYSARLA